MPKPAVDQVIQEVRSFVSRPTPNPPGHEERLTEYLIERLDNSPVEFSVSTQTIDPGRQNVVARVGDPSRGRLLLTGHIDTVPADEDQWSTDPYDLSLRDGRMIGRGVVDMKAACAAMLLATEDYVKSVETPGEVILGFVADEECSGTGTQTLVKSGPKVDAAILGEPSNMDIAIMNKGSVRYTVRMDGKSVHSARPDNGVNVIDAVPGLVTRLNQLDETVRYPDHEYLPPGGSLSVTELSSGIAANVIPDRAKITIDWRFVPEESHEPKWFDEEIEKTLDSVCKSFKGISTTYDRWNYKPAFAVDSSERVVSAVMSATSDAGHPANISGFEAGTDAGYLSEAGIPTVIFGPGRIDTQAHSVDESVPVQDVVSAVTIYRRCIERYFGDITS